MISTRETNEIGSPSKRGFSVTNALASLQLDDMINGNGSTIMFRESIQFLY